MKEFENDTRVIAAEGCLETTLDGETVLLHRDSGSYYGIRGVGSYVWRLIQEPVQVKEVVTTITDEYDVPKDRVERDVTAHLRELSEAGLLVPINDLDS